MCVYINEYSLATTAFTQGSVSEDSGRALNLYIHVYIYICIYIHIFAYMYIYIYIHVLVYIHEYSLSPSAVKNGSATKD